MSKRSAHPEARAAATARVAGGLSDAALRAYVADMDRAALALARRHDPQPKTDYWGRPPGWERIDLDRLPTLGLANLSFEDAQRINAYRPSAPSPPSPAKPFVLKASGPERERALYCLAQAVYFEAAQEPLEGRQAVAQTVLNRLRHPEYPKSICGVVYEGSQRATGCQFSFTCDGSLNRTPNATLWAQARRVAEQALSGFVYRPIGTATHYHADYVAPYWAPTLVKLGKIGAHIFYRWTGPAGEPAAFIGRYAGGEFNLSQEVLFGSDARTQGLALARGVASLTSAAPIATMVPSAVGPVQVISVPDAAAPGGVRTRVAGSLAGRRQPTPEQVDYINANLKALEERLAGKASSAPASASQASTGPD